MSVLTFLQELLDGRHASSTLKVYVAAIAATHAPMSDLSIGKHDLVVKFLRGAKRLKPPRPCSVLSWDLSTVIRALRGPPFELLESADHVTVIRGTMRTVHVCRVCL